MSGNNPEPDSEEHGDRQQKRHDDLVGRQGVRLQISWTMFFIIWLQSGPAIRATIAEPTPITMMCLSALWVGTYANIYLGMVATGEMVFAADVLGAFMLVTFLMATAFGISYRAFWLLVGVILFAYSARVVTSTFSIAIIACVMICWIFLAGPFRIGLTP